MGAFIIVCVCGEGGGGGHSHIKNVQGGGEGSWLFKRNSTVWEGMIMAIYKQSTGVGVEEEEGGVMVI